MNKNAIMTESAITTLEDKLDQLIRLCDRLKQENEAYQEKESKWLRERTRLIEKNELARTRVEAMISKLQNLESES
ncbi:MAG: TIGR02449 family protein [Cellvibrionaceae bacterium]